MSKEMIFLYKLYTIFYKYDLKKVNVSNEALKFFLPYLKCMLDEEEKNEIMSLFMVDENGVYSNYLKGVSSFDPLFAVRNGNEVNILLNDEMSNIFYDENIDYIGEKVAVLRKIKEKDKMIYENN